MIITCKETKRTLVLVETHPCPTSLFHNLLIVLFGPPEACLLVDRSLKPLLDSVAYTFKQLKHNGAYTLTFEGTEHEISEEERYRNLEL